MKKSWLIILSVTLLLLFQTDSFACRCGKPSVAKSFEEAAVIFTGEVIKLDDFRATIKVKKVWKGKSKEEIVMLTGTTKSDKGWYVSSTCDFSYVLGEKYLIYAYGSEDELKTNDCARTQPLEHAKEDIKELEKLEQETEKNDQVSFQQRQNLKNQWM